MAQLGMMDMHEHDWKKERSWKERDCDCEIEDKYDLLLHDADNPEHTNRKIKWVCHCGETKVTEHD